MMFDRNVEGGISPVNREAADASNQPQILTYDQLAQITQFINPDDPRIPTDVGASILDPRDAALVRATAILHSARELPIATWKILYDLGFIPPGTPREAGVNLMIELTLGTINALTQLPKMSGQDSS